MQKEKDSPEAGCLKVELPTSSGVEAVAYEGEAAYNSPDTGAPHALYWSEEEQAVLEERIRRFPPNKDVAVTERLIAISQVLPRKTVRDVALRMRWMESASSQNEGKDIMLMNIQSGEKLVEKEALTRVHAMLDENVRLINDIRKNIQTGKNAENLDCLVRLQEGLRSSMVWFSSLRRKHSHLPYLPVRLQREANPPPVFLHPPPRGRE
mmetsp:Transcript_5304/g.11907  ORF Transcript_5304/g.11907 Transcript_5304/m.11907 type:complete len:209 (+) Transcript_5304:107-733(+)